MRHLNVCLSSVYVLQDGTWKLSGFEHLWSAKDVNQNILDKSQSYRYKPCIDSNEIKNAGIGLEQYAFGVLCEEVLKSMQSGEWIICK